MKMMLYVFLVVFNILIYSCSGVTTTGNNGNIMAYLNVPELSQRIAAKVSATDKNIEVKAFLYKQDNPYKAIDSLEVSGQEYFSFTNLEYGKYAIRVDVDGEQGGLYENIEVLSEEQVVIKIVINIYIIQNFYVGLSDAEVLELLSKFETGRLVRSGDTVYVKTLQELVQDTVFVINGKDTLVSTKGSSSNVESSSSESSSSEPIQLSNIEYYLNNDNAKDAHFNTDTNKIMNYNYGTYKMFHTAFYDKSTVLRSVLEFDLFDSIPYEKASKVFLTLTSCEWFYKKGKDSTATINIHKVLKPWLEGLGYDAELNNDSINGITGKESFFGENWSEPGLGLNDVDASAKIYSSAKYNLPVISANNTSLRSKVEFDITELVKEWSTNKSSNYGLLMKASIENYADADIPILAGWCSTESPELESRPSIKIEF